MKKTGKLITDTVILTAVGIIMQTVSVSFNLYLTKKIGTAGMGLFQLVMSVYSLSVTFSTAGARLASTRIAAEISAKRNSSEKAIRQCLLYSLTVSCAIGAAMLIFSPFIAKSWIDNPDASSCLKILALSLPFVAMSGTLSGYFTATGFVPHYSGVRLFEQLFKIVTVVIALGFLLPYGSVYACEAVVIGMTASEAASFALARLLYGFAKRKEKALPCEKPKLFSLLRIALPDFLGSSTRSILLTIEHLMIPKGFEKSGSSQQEALSAYGIIHAMVLPVLLYPSSLLSSVATLIIPEMAKKNALGDKKSIDSSANLLLQLTLVFAIGCAAVMYFFANGLSVIIGNTESEHYLKVLAFLVPVMYCDMTVDGILRGLDQQFHSMVYNIIDSALCVALVYFLLPVYSIKGYVFILYISELINFYLSTSRLLKVCQIRFSFKNTLLKPLICATVSCALFIPSFPHLAGNKIITAIAITAAAVIYITLLCITRSLNVSELRSLIKSSL